MPSKYKVAVIGCGKLGAPMVGVFAEAGHKVLGIDLDPDLIRNLQNFVVPWNEPGLQELLLTNSAQIEFSEKYEGNFQDKDISFIIVPTPSKNDGSFSNQYVKSAVVEIGKNLKESKVTAHTVVIVSTVMPGSTSGEIKSSLLEALGESKVQISICYSPEFIALGSVIQNMKFPDMFLIGEENEDSGDLLEDFAKSYLLSSPTVHRLSTIEAELAKIAINSYVTMKISYSNQISEMCEKTLGASADRVLASIGSDSRIGSSYLKAATAFGGPCFPRDNRALSKYASDISATSKIAEATDVINLGQSQRLLSIVQKKLGQSKRLVLVGAAYKPDTDVIEESPAIRFAELALKDGYQIEFVDDYVSSIPLLADINVHRLDKASDAIKESDGIILFVPASIYENLPQFLSNNGVIFDLWGTWRKFESLKGQNYFRLGNNYEKKE